MDHKLSISLSKEQRDLLLKYAHFFADHELFRAFSEAEEKRGKYSMLLEKEQLGFFLNQLDECCYYEEDEDVRFELEDLYDHIEQYSDTSTDDEDYSDQLNNTGSVYTFKVALADTPKIWRRISIRGGQNLHDLHIVIFDAFEREEDHLCSFFLPFHSMKFNPLKIYKSSEEYTHPCALQDSEIFDCKGKDASKKSLKSLNLTEKQVFYYLFDFGDAWWHTITVEKTDGVADSKNYPRIIECKGIAPEQYEEGW